MAERMSGYKMNIKAIQIKYDSNMENMFACAAKAGFRWIAVSFGNGSCLKEEGWQEVAPRIKELLAQNDLHCIQTHLPCYDLLLSGEMLQEETEQAIHRAIIASKQLGARWCVAHPRSAVSQNYSSRAGLQQNLKAFTRYGNWAEEVDIGIAVENIPLFPGIYQMRFFSSDYEDLLELVERLHNPNISICWDFGHAYLTYVDQQQALRRIGSKLSCTHIHNNFRTNDNHLPPSVGGMEWSDIMPVLKEIGYQGPLTLEVNYGYEDTVSLSIDYGKNGMLESFVAHNYGCANYLAKLME